jgi:hypothetical protein
MSVTPFVGDVKPAEIPTDYSLTKPCCRGSMFIQDMN